MDEFRSSRGSRWKALALEAFEGMWTNPAYAHASLFWLQNVYQ
jgi:hypothetical protein